MNSYGPKTAFFKVLMQGPYKNPSDLFRALATAFMRDQLTRRSTVTVPRAGGTQTARYALLAQVIILLVHVPRWQ